MMCIACDVQGGHGGNRSSDEAEQERAGGGGGGGRANMHSSQSRGVAHQRSARPEPGGGGHQGGYDAGTCTCTFAPAGRGATVYALCVSGHTDIKGMLRCFLTT